MLTLEKPARSSDPIATLLRSPLIIGASVSADFNSVSPGKKLALAYTGRSNIRTEARNGRMGRETLLHLSDSDFSGRTIVFALDLFFWDSAALDLKPSLAAVKDLFKKLRAHRLPMVIGDVPELLMPGYQRHRREINEAIYRECAAYPRCQVLSFDRMREELASQRFLILRGRKLTFREIVPDGLHLSPVASDCLMEEVRSLVERLPREA